MTTLTPLGFAKGMPYASVATFQSSRAFADADAQPAPGRKDTSVVYVLTGEGIARISARAACSLDSAPRS